MPGEEEYLTLVTKLQAQLAETEVILGYLSGIWNWDVTNLRLPRGERGVTVTVDSWPSGCGLKRYTVPESVFREAGTVAILLRLTDLP